MDNYQNIPVETHVFSNENLKLILSHIEQATAVLNKDLQIVLTNSHYDSSEWNLVFEHILQDNIPLKESIKNCFTTKETIKISLFQTIPITIFISPLESKDICLVKFKKDNDHVKQSSQLSVFHYLIEDNTLKEQVGINENGKEIVDGQVSLIDDLAKSAFVELQNSNTFSSRVSINNKHFNQESFIVNGNNRSFLNITLSPANTLEVDSKKIVAIENSKTSIFIADKHGQIIYFNAILKEKLGIHNNSHSFPNIKDLKYSSLASEDVSQLWSTIEAGKPWEGEIGFNLSNNRLFWALFSISHVQEDDDTLMYLGVEHTAQELYTVLNELQRHYTFLDSIIDALQFPFKVYDPNNYTVLHSNKAAESFTGKIKCKIEGGRGKPYCKACLSSDVNYCLLQECAEKLEPVVDEFEIEDEETIRFYELSIYPVVEEGKISALIETAVDVTDRKKLDITQREDDIHKLEANKQKTLLASVINSIPDQIFYKDIEGSYFGANTAFKELAGTNDINGQKDFDIFPKELAYYFSLQDQLVLKKDIPAKSEKWVQFPNGKRVLLDTLRVPFKFQGDTVGVIGISRDITNIKRAQREIIDQKDRIQKHNSEIQSQRDEIELQRDFVTRQNEEITQSINYALRIQNAVLPQREEIDSLLDDYFIFFQPRNIVSGDFYWCAQMGDTTLIAAADCTGHGVPGALMSILGVAFLKQVVAQVEKCDTAEILNRLRKHIILSLHQTGKEGEATDGMDVALYAVNNKTKKLQFSGAYNPMYLVRNGKLTEFKGDKMPISLHAIKSEFTSTTIQLQENDMVYIFSDGYPDQFGGKADKKLKSSNFKKLITKYSKHPMDKQHKMFKHFFNSWKGAREQVDDILLIGARF